MRAEAAMRHWTQWRIARGLRAWCAWHEASGRVLVRDVWPHTRPSWICVERLWASIAGTDEESGLSRGWVVVGDGVGSV